MFRTLLAAVLLVLPQPQPTLGGTDASRAKPLAAQIARSAPAPAPPPARVARDTNSAGLKSPSKYPVAEWILFGVQVGSLLGLLFYVWKTWQIAAASEAAATATADSVNEMRRAREEGSQPRVVVYFSSASTTYTEIVTENFGDGTAADVTCTFEPPLQTTRRGDPERFFATPKWIPPRSRLTHVLDFWSEYLKSDLPRRYTVTVTYTDVAAGKQLSGSFILDFTAFEHMLRFERKDIHDVAKALEKLSERLEAGLSRLQAIEERRDAVWQATPSTLDLRVAVSQVIGSWRLLRALATAPHAYAIDTHYLAGMRNEPPRDFRRLHTVRSWSHDQVEGAAVQS